MPVFLSGCLLPFIRKTGIQHSWIQWLSTTYGRIFLEVVSSRVGLPDRGSNCIVMVFIRSNASSVAEKSQMVVHYHVGERKAPSYTWIMAVREVYVYVCVCAVQKDNDYQPYDMEHVRHIAWQLCKAVKCMHLLCTFFLALSYHTSLLHSFV